MGGFKKEIQSLSDSYDLLYPLMEMGSWELELPELNISDDLRLKEIEDILNDCSTNSNNELGNVNR